MPSLHRALAREQRAIDAEWRSLNFTGPPDYDRALGEYEAFLALVTGTVLLSMELQRYGSYPWWQTPASAVGGGS